MAREVHLELLLGRKVRDSSGRTVGRIEEVRAAQRDDEWFVTEYLLGPAAWFERLSVWSTSLGIVRLPCRGYTVPWDQLDISSHRLKLRCSVDKLQPVKPSPSSLTQDEPVPS